VLDESEQDIVEHVRRGDAEFAIDMEMDASDDDLIVTPVMKDRFVMACRHDHPLAKGGPVTWDALADMPVVTLGQRSGTSRLLYAQLPKAQNSLAWRYEVQHLSTKMAFVEAGLGVGIIPEMSMQTAAGGALVYRPLAGPDLARRIVLVERKDATLSPAAAALKDALMAAFRVREMGNGLAPVRRRARR
jgi:DNA-binding transcriptional LysR family regulator